MHHAARMLLASIAAWPAAALAQSSLYDEYDVDPSTSRPPLPTPAPVAELERTTARPPCGAPAWGRSRLDGSLASRRRPEGLPCRTVWESTVRFELGLVGGGLTDRDDGGWGGLSLSIGWRYHEALSVYYLSLLMFGGWDRAPGATYELASLHAVLFEVSPFAGLGVAFGPSMDFGAGCDVGVAQGGTECAYAPYYGLHSRLTANLATLPFGGLTLTADLHVTLAEPDPRASALLGLGLRL